MAFTLPDLPYPKDSLVPYLSAETLEFHHDKHHAAYVNNLNRLIEGTEKAEMSLEEIILSSEGPLFNNAAQTWNHTFYWQCMKPDGGGEPQGQLRAALEKDFGSFGDFRSELIDAAVTLFGAGWAWLVLDKGTLKVTRTSNADLPMRHGQTALLTIDVWEHAYYIDYRNERPKYVQACVDNLVNWSFMAENLASVQ